MKKKLLSLIMSAALLAGLMPVNIQAQEADAEPLQTEATTSDADVLDVTETEEEILVEDTLEVEANSVRIDATNFPDENFRKYIKEYFDRNNDGVVDDIGNITYIYVGGSEIRSLKGIEFFWALESLLCDNNQLTSLDVSKNTALRSLGIDSNITTDISNFDSIGLSIYVPQVKGTIDLSNITGIEKYILASGWNGDTKKLTYELNIYNNGHCPNWYIGIGISLNLMNFGEFATYQGYDFCKDANGNIRCTDSDGNPVINEFKCDGTYTYYFQLDGTAMINRLTYHPDGKHVIYFDENGHEVFSNFHHVEQSIAGEVVDDLCFFDVYGYMYVDVMTYDQAGEKLYYVNPYGVIERGKWFEFSDTCVWAGTTNKVGKGYGYANADGTLMINTYTYDWLGRFVYMQGNGHIQ